MAMDTLSQDYYLSEDKCQNWDNEWSSHLSTWTTTQTPDMPLWQYASVTDTNLSYFPNSTSSLSSPTLSYSHPDGLAPPPASIYPSRLSSGQPSPNTYMESEFDEEDSDGYSWGPGTPASGVTSDPSQKGHARKRGSSGDKLSVKNAKRAHTVVERNYRERLNDKIADLGLYLFETSSDSRTRPSKSLVMTRAKERLQQLESRNKSLEDEVTKLRQHIAILEHVNSNSGSTKSN